MNSQVSTKTKFSDLGRIHILTGYGTPRSFVHLPIYLLLANSASEFPENGLPENMDADQVRLASSKVNEYEEQINALSGRTSWRKVDGKQLFSAVMHLEMNLPRRLTRSGKKCSSKNINQAWTIWMNGDATDANVGRFLREAFPDIHMLGEFDNWMHGQRKALRK